MGKSGGIVGTILGGVVGAILGGPVGALAEVGLSGTTGAVAGGLLGAGLGSQIGGAISAQSVTLPSPPSPANYYYYNDEGQVTQEMVWDASRNAYIYKTAPLTPEQRAEKQKRQEIRLQLLNKLQQTPQEDLKRYEEYANQFAEAMRKPVEEQYQLTKAQTEETFAKRGMFGSKAYADVISELEKQRGEAEREIAQRATLAKEELAQQDRNYWLNLLGQLDAGVKTDALLELQRAGQAQQAVQQATAGLQGLYQSQLLGSLQKMQQQQALSNLFNNLGGTAVGLMYLYGKAGNMASASAPASNITLSPPRVSNNFMLTPSGWIRY